MAVEAELTNLETQWAAHEYDNYKDALQECGDLLAETAEQPALEARVVVVLNAVIKEIEELADPQIDDYLGEWGTRAYWEQIVGRPLA